MLALLSLLGIGKAYSQTDYATILTGSNWNVPLENQLAYGANASSGFSSPFVLGDQTTWGCQLGVGGCTTSSTSGISVTGTSGGITRFTGSATGTMQIGLLPPIVGYNAISGAVTSSGTIAMVFTPTNSSGVVTSGASTTLGLGQFQNVGGVNEMEMQMITGTSLLVTHWAYMTPYTGPNSAATTPIANPPSNANPYYSWTSGTVWKIVDRSLFGTAAPGRFVVSNYNGGYFYGFGVGPKVNPIIYTQLGSITPQGKVLFATMASGTQVLNASYGELTGSSGSSVMTLADYDSTTASPTGSVTLLSQISPYSSVISSTNNPAAAGAANTLWNLGTSEAGLTGAMAPVLLALDNYSGKDLSNTISQTLPLLTGAGSQATANSQRIINQFVMARQNNLSGQSNGEEILGNKEVWGKVYGSWGNQQNWGNVAGYSNNTGGFILGGDQILSPQYRIGAFLGFSSSSLSSNNNYAPSNLNISSYQLGAYGNYDLRKDLNWNYQLNGALNQNTGSRNISFYGVTANSSYNSYTGHLGTGLQQYFDLNDKTRITPTLRADYLTIQSNAYSESNAGPLSLNVNNQTWNELYTTAGIKFDYQFMPKVTFSTNIAAGYNLLNRQVLITSSYQGGGDPFTTYGLQLSPWLYSGGVGIGGMIHKDIELNIRYDLQTTSSSYVNQIASAKLKFYM
jgi:outer membrane autotransporter protein